MTTANSEMSLDAIPIHSKVTRKFPERPSLCVEQGQKNVIIRGEFGLGTPAHVRGGSNGFDVLGVHTEADSAEVVGLQTLGPRTYALYPNSTVRNGLLPSEEDLSVPLFPHGRPSPHPTWGCIPSVLNSEITFIQNPSSSRRHTATAYHPVFVVRVSWDGYEETL